MVEQKHPDEQQPIPRPSEYNTDGGWHGAAMYSTRQTNGWHGSTTYARTKFPEGTISVQNTWHGQSRYLTTATGSGWHGGTNYAQNSGWHSATYTRHYASGWHGASSPRAYSSWHGSGIIVDPDYDPLDDPRVFGSPSLEQLDPTIDTRINPDDPARK